MRRIQIEAAPVKNDVGLSVKLHYGYVYYYENARMNFCPKIPEQPVHGKSIGITMNPDSTHISTY
jgi:hypothetical protein